MASINTTQLERLARVEVEIHELKKSFEDHKTETSERFDRLERKLDDLITLRNKGAGILWLISLIFGTSGVLAVMSLIRYWTH